MMRIPIANLWLACLGWSLAGAPAAAQLSNAPLTAIVGARLPALSPHGKQLAFVYRGDIWLAPSKGGRARPLTRHIELDAFPQFSPDGSWIAFASKRSGGWNIFAIPTAGGPARQLTWHASSEMPQGWSPDGTRLLFSTRRDTENYSIYALEVATLRDELLCEDYASLSYPHYSPDGKQVVYSRYGFHWTRGRYHGSAAAQLWLLDVASRVRRPLTTNSAQHLWPQFLPDGKHIVTVTTGAVTPSASPLNGPLVSFTDNPQRTPNLWRFDLRGHGQLLTHFTGHAVRYPTVASRSGDIAFEYQADLWFMRRGRKAPVKIQLFAAADEAQTTRRREVLRNGVTEAEPSPDGRYYAFGLRGDIWTVPINKPKGVAGRNADQARRLTDYVGDDSDFSWSPDGKKMYFVSDRGFRTRIYELDLGTLALKSLWNRAEFVTGPRISADGKKLGFWVTGPEGGLHVLDLSNGDVRRIAKVPGPQWHGLGGGSFAWSPDMQWIAFTKRGASRAWNIWIAPADGGPAVNVTQLYANHSQPAWSPDGQYLFFQSDRAGSGLYVLPLVPEKVRTVDTDLKFAKPAKPVRVKIDFDGITERIRKLSSQSPQSDLTVTVRGQILFLSQNDVWSVSYDGRQTRRLTTGGGKTALRVSADGKQAYFMNKGELSTMRVDSKSIQKVTFTAELERDRAAEHDAAFTQFWNNYSRGYYDPNFHGRDWTALRQLYRPMLDAARTEDEFAWVLQMMVGELDTSHSEVTGASSRTSSVVTPYLGFTFDYSYSGPGLRVRDVPPGAPPSFPQTAIYPGEYVLQINGQDVRLDEHLYEAINNKPGRMFEFLVNTNPAPKGARTVKYQVLSSGEWKKLLYENRVERNRQHVETRSHHRIGYLHLAAMQSSQREQFEREAYEYIAGHDALIIDVRFNAGGNIADTLIDWLGRKPHGFLRPRDCAAEPSPLHAWEKPVVVLINEHSYSNGEIFAYAVRARGLGTLVGMPTPGYVIWTTEARLVDGTKARLPQSGFYRLDGTPLESHGEPPDVRVPLTPEDWLARRDPQLDKAIELLSQPKPAAARAKE